MTNFLGCNAMIVVMIFICVGLVSVVCYCAWHALVDIERELEKNKEKQKETADPKEDKKCHCEPR